MSRWVSDEIQKYFFTTAWTPSTGMGLKNKAHIPASEQCPCKPYQPYSVPSAMRSSVSAMKPKNNLPILPFYEHQL